VQCIIVAQMYLSMMAINICVAIFAMAALMRSFSLIIVESHGHYAGVKDVGLVNTGGPSRLYYRFALINTRYVALIANCTISEMTSAEQSGDPSAWQMLRSRDRQREWRGPTNEMVPSA